MNSPYSPDCPELVSAHQRKEAAGRRRGEKAKRKINEREIDVGKSKIHIDWTRMEFLNRLPIIDEVRVYSPRHASIRSDAVSCPDDQDELSACVLPGD